MTLAQFLLLVGFGLILIGCMAFLGLFGFWIALIRNLHTLSDLSQTNPELYAEIKRKLQSKFPQVAEPLHMKGDFAWRYLLSEENISKLERADELRHHPAIIKRNRIMARLKVCLIIVVFCFSVGGSLFLWGIKNK